MASFFNRRGSSDPTPDDDSPDQASTELAPPESQTGVQSEKTEDHARTFDTALGAGSVLEGKLISDGNVRLDGKLNGTLEIGENVLVGTTAEIEADIAAKHVSIAGTVRGDVSGERVHLLSTARVIGNINARSLVTEDGAFIDGRITMKTSPPTASEPHITHNPSNPITGDDPL